MKSKKILTLIFAVLLVFSLFGCGKKEPVADVEPQDTVEQEKLPPIVTEKEKPQEEVPLTTEELHALFKKEYEFFKWAKANLYDDQYQEYYLKLPAREIGTQTDANVYADIEKEVAKPEYEGKILPDDGFEQYVAWREAYMPDNSQTGTGETGSTEIKGIPDENTEEPFDGNDDPSLIDKDSQNVYDDAHITNEVKDYGVGESSVKKEYETPSYEIVG
jgi:predicted small lipoprotein YifL